VLFYDLSLGQTKELAITTAPAIGPVDVQISIASPSSSFSIAPGDLHFTTDQPRTVNVTFSPLQAAAYSTVLHVTTYEVDLLVLLSGSGVTSS
jgi:hypothetical protein